MPKMRMIVARLMRLVDNHAGSVNTKSPSPTASSARAPTTGQAAQLPRDGADLLRACQVAEASVSTRYRAVRLRRASSNPARTIPNRTASLYAGRLLAWKVMPGRRSCADRGGGDGGEALEPAEHRSREGLHQERGREWLADR